MVIPTTSTMENEGKKSLNKNKLRKLLARSPSWNFPKIRHIAFGKKGDKGKRAQSDSIQYTPLETATSIWELVNSSDTQTPQEYPEAIVNYPTDVTFIAPYTFVVADSEGHKLDIFDISREEGHQHCGTLAEHKVWPNSLAKSTSSDEQILVTDRKDRMIKVYDIKTETLVSSYGSPFADEDIPYWPHGVTMTMKKEIVVTETSKHRVHVFSNKGKLQHTFGQLGNLIENFCLPFYCSVDAADRILISDNLNYSVKIFTTKGRQIAYMGEGRQDNQHKKLGSPYGVCADFSGHVLVCDHEKNRIVQYDLATAEYEKEITTKSSVGLLSVSRKSTEVAIPEYKNEVMGRMNGCTAPCGIAVGPCGTMVYTECAQGISAVKAYSLYSLDDRSLHF